MSARITAFVVSRALDGILAHCLDRFERAALEAGLEGATVVVDNASTAPYLPADLGPRRLPAELVRFDLPCGFATANNAAAAHARADLFLLLNNDVLLHERALASMHAVLCREPRAAICGARLLFPDGTIQHNGVVFGPGRIGPYHADRRRPGRLVPRGVREFQAVTGACMLVQADLWLELGGLDETYPFGLEDIDFCLRARQRGARVLCAGDVDSLHFESMTPGRVELDVPSRRLFMKRWGGRYTIDG